MSPRRVLAVLALSELFAMAPWFSASAVAPTLVRLWGLGPPGAAWLTISVQLGFVVGALASAALTLADVWSARRMMAGAAVLAGFATLGVAAASGPAVAVALRFATGSEPGSPRHTGHVRVLASPPNVVGQAQNIFDSVASSTWHSSPITVS